MTARNAVPASTLAAIRRELPSVDVFKENAVSALAKTQRSVSARSTVRGGRGSPAPNVVEAVRAALSSPAVRSKDVPTSTLRHAPEAADPGETVEDAGPVLRQPLTGPAARHEGPAGQPSHQQIQERAFQIFLERAGRPGSPETDWYQAERELQDRMKFGR
ncbi:MAG: DUF2934 domain-containing protein [Planctomycetota bacterium]